MIRYRADNSISIYRT